MIVHKVDRLARNRADDVEITLAIRATGATSISCSENIDETPSGLLLHGIMSSIAEFYSRNLANEVIKGCVQKAKGRRHHRQGASRLPEHPEYRERPRNSHCRTRPGARPADPVGIRDLRDRRLVDHPPAQRANPPRACLRGNRTNTRAASAALAPAQAAQPPLLQGHRPLPRHRVPGQARATGQRRDLAARSRRPRRPQPVAARSSAFTTTTSKAPSVCGQCGSRLIITNARSRHGKIYPYFVCVGRHQKRTDCTFKAILIETVERKVEAHYAAPRSQPGRTRRAPSDALATSSPPSTRRAAAERRRLEKQRKRLLAERAKLLQAHYAEAVPLDLLKSEQDRIREQLDQIDKRLAATDQNHTLIESNLRGTLNLVTDAQADLPVRTTCAPPAAQPSSVHAHPHRGRRRRHQRPRRAVQDTARSRR